MPENSGLIPDEAVIRIVEAGILAPSGDNCQPWQVYINGGKLYLKNIEDKDRSLYNTKSIASFIAFGAMIENMTITAGSLGYDTSVTLFPEGENSSVVAAMDFVRGRTIVDPLLRFISKRCVNRKRYKPEQLGSQAKESLLKAAAEIQGAEIYIIEDDAKKRQMAKVLSINDRILFENKNLHDFLFDHLRWSKEEVESTRDGMSIESLELGDFQGRMFRLFASWKLVGFLNFFGFSRLVPAQSYKLCAGSTAVCVLLMKGTGFDGFVNGGRALQKIWLTASSLGMSLHPMTGVTLLIQRMRMTGKNDLSSAHEKVLRKLEGRLKKLLPIDDGKSIIMTFRIGYADPPSDKSLRLPVDKVLIKGLPGQLNKRT